MKRSLQEIKEENLLKEEAFDPSLTKAIVKYTPKPQPDRGGSCYKHGALHNQCAKIGIQRTKAKRWRVVGDRFYPSGSFMNDKQTSDMEAAYKKAKDAFHAAICTCHTAK